LANLNRTISPWVVVTGHRPFYASDISAEDDKLVTDHLRLELEGVFMEYKVDLVLTGHYHQYERTCPVFNETCYPSGQAPVHAIVGTAGIEKLQGWGPNPPAWSISRTTIYGYAQIDAHNSTALHFWLINTENDTIDDDFWIIKE